MTDPVPPVHPATAAQAVRRGRALVVLGRPDGRPSEPTPDERPSAAAARPGSVSAVGAQLLGEKPRRGLRAGPEVLDQARSTYLQNEFSGVRDRRPRKGQLTRTDV
jgi:hypothetical protein